MNDRLPKINAQWLECRQTKSLMSMFEQAGYTARFVGGVVRNALLGEPVNDLDIATDAPPQKVMELAQSQGFKAIGTGLEHGTVTVVIEHRVYEITTLRVDVISHGRHATVSFTDDWRQDAKRRDFTINALYVDGDGTLFDPLDGYSDVLARRVRFIGNPEHRIKEDYLRILRFFRFFAQYGDGAPDEHGLVACVALRAGLAGLSAERISAELQRLLIAPKALAVIDVMFLHGLLLPLTSCVPHITRLRRWTELETALERPVDAIDHLGAMFALVAEDVARLSHRLRLSNKQRSRLALWVKGNDIDGGLSHIEARKLYYLLGDDYQAMVAIGWVLANADIADAAWHRLYQLPQHWQPPSFPLKGGDLIAGGMKPGPAVGRRMAKLKNDWLESDFTLSKGQLLKL